MTRLIVVVPANSRQGSNVIETLLENPDEWYIRGTSDDLTSSQSQEFIRRGVDMVKCNINNREECCQVFAGAYGVFLITYYQDTTEQNEKELALNLIEAARISNIQHFIISGSPHTTVFEKSQLDLSLNSINKTQMADYICQLHPRSSLPRTTFIQGGFFYQNFITFFVLDTANLEFRYPLLTHARIPVYDLRDTGKVVRECFRHPEQWGNGQTVPIVAEQLSMDEICTTIREVIGKGVHFVPLSYDEALIKLHRETVNNFRLYNDIGSVDERQAEKTNKIWPHMKLFADWLREIQWLME